MPRPFQTVTLDCWGTLLYERCGTSPSLRSALLAEVVGCPEPAAREALDAAWVHHQRLWHRRTIFNGANMTRHALERLGARLDPARERELVIRLEDEMLTHDVQAVDGARQALLALRDGGVRRALICDTGFARAHRAPLAGAAPVARPARGHRLL